MIARRGFLQIILAGLGLTALGSFLYPLLRYFSPTAGEGEAEKLIVDKREIPVGGSKDILFHGTPSIIINRPQKGFIVLSKVCTHLGCLIDYEKAKKRFLCPCHAGVFDLEGNVVSGPPPAPLPQFALKIEGDNLVIG